LKLFPRRSKLYAKICSSCARKVPACCFNPLPRDVVRLQPQFTARYSAKRKVLSHVHNSKGKKSERINAPRVALKVNSKWFGFHLAEAIKFDGCVYGFVKGRSASMAATLHCGADWVYSIQLTSQIFSQAFGLQSSAVWLNLVIQSMALNHSQICAAITVSRSRFASESGSFELVFS